MAAAVRAVLALAAIPLAPFLYREHVAVLILLRPTKETLLYAGYAAENGDVSLPVAIVAALPILLVGVWQFFFLGREFGPELAKHDLPGIAGRLLPRQRIDRMRAALKQKGDKVVFLGRLAAMPSSLVAAAAGAAKFSLRRFLIIDTAGALVSLALMLSLGWFLDEAYEDAGPWLTTLGLAAIVAVAVVIGRGSRLGDDAFGEGDPQSAPPLPDGERRRPVEGLAVGRQANGSVETIDLERLDAALAVDRQSAQPSYERREHEARARVRGPPWTRRTSSKPSSSFSRHAGASPAGS